MAEPLLVAHSHLFMPSFPAHPPHPVSPGCAVSSSWESRSCLWCRTLCGLESSQKPHLPSWLCDLSLLALPLWALWALKYWNHDS